MGDYVPDCFLAASSDDVDVKPECQSNPANCSLTHHPPLLPCVVIREYSLYMPIRRNLSVYLYIF